MKTVSNWLLEKFREWEQKTGRRQSITAFARFLGVKQPTLNRWMMGDNLPDGDNVRKLADKLGYEIYELMERDPPGGAEYERNLAEVPPEYKEKFKDDLRGFMRSWMRDHGSGRD